VPVPPFRPCAERDDDVVPFCRVIALGGGRSGRGETPVSVQVLNISPEPIYIISSKNKKILMWYFSVMASNIPDKFTS